MWGVLAGRGWGKTKTGGETIRWLVEQAGYRRVGLIGRTAADVRDVIVQGNAGLENDYPPWERDGLYEPSKRRFNFPGGGYATTYSADKPDQLRGPEHDLILCDELAAWRYPEAYDMAQMGLRINSTMGYPPLTIFLTTPRPTPLIVALADDPNVYLTTGSTYENVANLAGSALDYLRQKYEGTRLGQQELHAKILTDVPGALWTRDLLEACRKRVDKLGLPEPIPDMQRIAIGIDPAVTATEDSNETGIILAGLGEDGHAYVFDDWSMRESPGTWAKRVVRGYFLDEVDAIVGETNNGGDLVEEVIRTVRDEDDKPIGREVNYRAVHASRGKYTRAEPIAALYEQGRVHHIGHLAELEDQMCTWVPGEKSPDRIDALVWVLWFLMLGEQPKSITRARAKGVYPKRR